MWNEPTKERLMKIPRLYETEDINLKDKQIYLHFFIGGCDWYIAEYDGIDIFWGYGILNNDLEMTEWGYISLSELRNICIGGFEVDCELEEFFPVTKASEIKRICQGNQWPLPEVQWHSVQYTQDDIECLLRQAVIDNVVELICPNCGGTLRCEPDARDSFCFDCDKVVSTNNPLIEMGLI